MSKSEKEKSLHLKKAEQVVSRLAVEAVDEKTLIELVSQICRHNHILIRNYLKLINIYKAEIN